MTNSQFINRVASIQAGLIGHFKMALVVDGNNIMVTMFPLKPQKEECEELNISIPIAADSNTLTEAWNNFLHYSMYEEINKIKLNYKNE